jgi:hypothetical protein
VASAGIDDVMSPAAVFLPAAIIATGCGHPAVVQKHQIELFLRVEGIRHCYRPGRSIKLGTADSDITPRVNQGGSMFPQQQGCPISCPAFGDSAHIQPAARTARMLRKVFLAIFPPGS